MCAGPCHGNYLLFTDVFPLVHLLLDVFLDLRQIRWRKKKANLNTAQINVLQLCLFVACVYPEVSVSTTTRRKDDCDAVDSVVVIARLL